MRVILDTNIVVSALIWGGTPYKLLQAATAGDIELFTSPVLMTELRGVLARPHLTSRLLRQHASIEQAVRLYGELAVNVSPLSTPMAVPTDADDDHVIAVAVAARADLIVSGDRDLLRLDRYENIAIVDAAEAIQAIASAGIL